MLSKKNLGRLSGFIYLLLIVTGIFGVAYVPSTLIIWENPATTVSNIKSHEMLFRLGILSEIVCFLLFTILPLCLYKLFKSTNRNAAALMVVLALICIPLAFVNILNKVNALLVLSGAEYLGKMSIEELHAQVMYLLAAFNNGTMVASIFWGAWLLPLGYLVCKSTFLPSVLGILLMLACVSYQVEFIGRFVFSIQNIPWYVSMPSSVGEFGICLWLLIFGVRDEPVINSGLTVTR